MNDYMYYNDRILSIRKSFNLHMEAASQERSSCDTIAVARIKKLIEELDKLWISMPEVTERDHFLDRVWDKWDEQKEVRDWYNSIEYSIRFETLHAEAKAQLDTLWNSLTPDAKECVHEWACEIADYERYGDDQI